MEALLASPARGVAQQRRRPLLPLGASASGAQIQRSRDPNVIQRNATEGSGVRSSEARGSDAAGGGGYAG